MTKSAFPIAISIPQGSLDAYIQAANHMPSLSADEEKDLAVRLRRDNDLEAARQLVLSHLRYVVYIARGYRGYGLPQGDLIQEGNIGLMKAVKRFDPDMGVRMVSFAVHWIRAEMHEYILRNWRIVKVATTKAQRKLFFNLRKSKTRLGWFSEEEVNAVANNLGVSPATVREMEARLSHHDTPFDGYPDEDSESSDSFAPAGYLTAANADPALILENEDWDSQSSEKLANALKSLDKRSLDILQRRWLDDEKSTLHELAATFDVSAERIRQLEKNALKKLRDSLLA